MSDPLMLKFVEGIEAERSAVGDHLQARGFRPTRLNKASTTYAPVAPPAPPGFIVASLDRSGLASVPPGMVEASVGPELSARIKLAAESIRLAGVPVLVLLIDATPTEAKIDA